MTGPHLTRRRALAGMLTAAGAVLAQSALAACGTGGSPGSAGASGSSGATGSAVPAGTTAKWPKLTAREVVLAGFGGETYQIRHQETFDPFATVSGARVVDAPWDYGKFINMIASPAPEWDLIDFDGYSVAGLILAGKATGKLADWVRRCDLVPTQYRDYCAGGYAWSNVLGHSTKLGATPSSWADFFDTGKFPGKRAFPKSLYMGTVEVALLADGVSKDKIYPLDFDRAFAKLNTLRGDLLFYDTYAQGQQYMAQGSTSMILTSSSRVQQLKDDGQPVDYSFQDGILYPWSSFTMPRNPPHADAANALLDLMSTPEQQAAIAKKLRLGPTVSGAFDLLSPAELALVPSAPANVAKQLTIDVASCAAQDEEYVKRFTAWVGT
ncbi:MAG: putative spermidine/putrescine transport system substrate-binding protein [Pseudonocardiales bacterium]|nr:putative spermidine/putrescine transport system substrate-binding protein [Pseudonocardiales bacterium]